MGEAEGLGSRLRVELRLPLGTQLLAGLVDLSYEELGILWHALDGEDDTSGEGREFHEGVSCC
jgi:hypothetical protein